MQEAYPRSVLAPGHLMAGAGPVLVSKDRPAALAHLPVETSVVRDDHRRNGSEGMDGHIVDALSGDVGIGNTGEPGDRLGDRLLGLVQLIEGFQHTVDAPAGAVLELDDAELDDLVVG